MAKISPKFNALYKKLNTEQKTAVDAIEGPVMVIAGPGTGKTQILTLRVANILKRTDTPPDGVLALTFTESGVFSMRKRLVEIIGSDGYRVGIYTFHGFCNDVIKRYPDEFPRIIGSSHINDVDKIGILRELIRSTDLKHVRPFGDTYYYLDSIRRKISELKREYMTPEGLKKRVKKQKKSLLNLPDLYHTAGSYKGQMKGKYANELKKIERNLELAELYRRYEAMLRDKKLYDYEDMIVETIRTLETNRSLLLRLQEQYLYILADEHQDANNSQNRLLELLSGFHETPNLFIVGDEKQAIFRFQGASLENFLYFKERFPGALLIKLRFNFRSTQGILDAAHSLILKGMGDTALRVPLRSAGATLRSAEDKVEIRAFTSQDIEYASLAHEIKKKIAEGVEAPEIAVLYRTNRDADPIVEVFEREGIPFSVESDQNVLLDEDIRKLVLMLEAVHHFGSDSRLAPLLSIDFFGVDPLDAYRLFRFAAERKKTLYSIISDDEELARVGLESFPRVCALYKRLRSWKRAAENENLLSFLQIVMEESGFLVALLQKPNSEDKLAKVRGFFNDVSSLVETHRDYRLPDLMNYIGLLREHNIMVRRDTHTRPSGSVRLMTAHRSKGLEFDYVFIVGANDRHWGNRRDIEHFPIPLSARDEEKDRLDDERRLFYVALTRARLGVSISYAREGKRGEPLLPSQFVEEIDKAYVREVDVSDFEAKLSGAHLLRPVTPSAPSLENKEFLNELFLRDGLSATALNNYLICPWDYFFKNLIKIPRARTKHQLFGTALHAALKEFFDALREDGAEKKTLLRLFRHHLLMQPLSERDFELTLQRGKENLSGWYDAYRKSWNIHTLNEFAVTVQIPVELSFGEAPVRSLRLRGDIDKMEFGEGGAVNVVDYKTRKPMSRNYIEGKTKGSPGNYKRQLVFYKLALDLYDGGRYRMETGEIDFLEPDSRGQYKKERFVMTPEDTKEIAETIGRVAQEILDLSFWDTRCDRKACDSCTLRELMKQKEVTA